MRKITTGLLVLCHALFIPTRAQQSELWGVSPVFGNEDAGYIYKSDGNGENLEIVHLFEGGEMGSMPIWGLTQGADEKIYGGTSAGGAFDGGVLFAIDQSSYNYEVLHHFSGGIPLGTMTLGSNGKLYGFISGGMDVLFEFDPTSSEYTELHEFEKATGRLTFGDNRLVEVSDNVYYGFTEYGGVADRGVIFKYNIEAAIYEVVFEFDGSEELGRSPTSLAMNSEGQLYGVTSWLDGRIFQFDIATNTYSTIFRLTDTQGINAGILLASDGNYYGTTGTGGTEGHGSLYRFNTGTGSQETLHSFLEFSGPHIPDAPVLASANGKLYGNTRYVSYGNAGITIFEYDMDTETFGVISQLSGGLAAYPLVEMQLPCKEDNETLEKVACGSYTFDGNEQTQSGEYIGSFTNQLGCDSLVTLNLTILSETDCITQVATITPDISVFPNPSTDGMVRFLGLETTTEYSLFNATGQLIQTGVIQQNEQIKLPQSHGFYFAHIITPKGVKKVKILTYTNQ
ncbi:Por secretion system C-terminal sorting domain-containing protein [Reichenbachiella faecimaris]|uniref:Por secretion system C-terminal sorting domain-containing protein n=1 Tax=Reichenbachiella faecimaris TaxID=692418 RepID=A0A1W2G9Z1_REIFA|nr:choice-of-anchor tandem repeat GloVer-containing protein [Reichenbachiella faecimaris]SMD33178.1 Por secretion system C-terminal sorting domain-containing protein [Reichenbachiella faecimaris]